MVVDISSSRDPSCMQCCGTGRTTTPSFLHHKCPIMYYYIVDENRRGCRCPVRTSSPSRKCSPLRFLPGSCTHFPGKTLTYIHYRTIPSHHLTCARRKETESMHHVVNRIVYTVPVGCLLSTFVAYTYLLYILYIYTRRMHVNVQSVFQQRV